MDLFFFGEYLDQGYLFLFLLHQRFEDELEVVNNLGSDQLCGFSLGGASLDSVVVEESEVAEVQRSVGCHC